MRNADRTFPAIIGGRTVPTDQTIASLCPAQPDLVIGRVAACTRDHVDQAVAAARAAFAEWAFTDVEQRAEKLVRLAELIRRNRFEFLALLGLEIGKDWFEAEAEIGEAIDFCEYYARLAVQHSVQPLAHPGRGQLLLLYPARRRRRHSALEFPAGHHGRDGHGGGRQRQHRGAEAELRHAGASPTGSSSCAPRRGSRTGVVNLVTGSGGEIGDYLVTHPEIRFVAFTGSADVGLRVDRLTAGLRNGRSG